MYFLFVGKNGTKLQPSSPDFTLGDGSKRPAGFPSGFAIGRRGDAYYPFGSELTMADLVQKMSMMAGRLFVDKTGLTGKYDFKTQFLADDSQPANAPGGEAASPPPPPSREYLPLAALRALGFRVESGKAPVEVIVIDHVERPSGN